jgi:hypothetical protein
MGDDLGIKVHQAVNEDEISIAADWEMVGSCTSTVGPNDKRKCFSEDGNTTSEQEETSDSHRSAPSLLMA